MKVATPFRYFKKIIGRVYRESLLPGRYSEAAINIIGNTVTNHDSASVFNYYPTFNPIEKIIELYEALLKKKSRVVAEVFGRKNDSVVFNIQSPKWGFLIRFFKCCHTLMLAHCRVVFMS